MAKAKIYPRWWADVHGSQWEHLKGALERDWEQTKKDLQVGGHQLHQSLTDTLAQAAGAVPVPPIPAFGWAEAEQLLMFGVGAREQFGRQHGAWDAALDAALAAEWERTYRRAWAQTWDEVRSVVRHGFEHAGQRPWPAVYSRPPAPSVGSEPARGDAAPMDGSTPSR